jgi:hypothetical protein
MKKNRPAAGQTAAKKNKGIVKLPSQYAGRAQPFLRGCAPPIPQTTARAARLPARQSAGEYSSVYRTTRGMFAASRQTIAAVAVWTDVHGAVRFMYLMIFKAAVNRAAVDAQNLRSADLVATGVCDRTAN